MTVVVAILIIIVSLLMLFISLGFFLFVLDLFLELPYVATNRKKIETIMTFARIKKGQTVVDLGSGDGRLLVAAAKKGAFAIGYEINPLLILVSNIHAKIKGLGDMVKIKNVSFWNADLKTADVIFVYAFIKKMPKFEEYIWKNAKKGTRVVVNTNPFPNKKPSESDNGVFLYIV